MGRIIPHLLFALLHLFLERRFPTTIQTLRGFPLGACLLLMSLALPAIPSGVEDLVCPKPETAPGTVPGGDLTVTDHFVPLAFAASVVPPALTAASSS